MQVRWVAVAVLVSALFAWILLTDIGSNPAGLFCDEAEIGIRTRELVNDDLPALRPRLFYSHLGYEHLGRCRCMPARLSLRRWACPTCQSAWQAFFGSPRR